MATAPIVIQTMGLSKTFNGIQALKNLDLTVHRNSIFGFLGPNGAGKTTAIKLLLGLLRPDAGGAKVFDLDIVQNSIAIRFRTGYLPQDPRFYEHMTARQTLDVTARFFFRGPDQAIRERVAEVLELVGLDDKADRPIKGFSGGERQRLGIAQAQVNYPDLLILDEPAASLDPIGRRDVLEVMGRLRKHTTIFYSTHILDDVQQVSDTVAILNRGELAASGPIEHLLAGSGGTAYQVSLRGSLGPALDLVRAQPWVLEVAVSQKGEETIWMVSVSDPELAESELARLILQDRSVSLREFRLRKFELEEVFMNIVQGANHGGQ